MENMAERMARLGIGEVSESRMESLTMAHELVDDATFTRLAGATRLYRMPTIVLPRLHLEGLSRGRGWARKGTGDNAQWGKRVDGGYRVGPGKWIVGATDGFRRKDSRAWTVANITVGDNIWTIANAN